MGSKRQMTAAKMARERDVKEKRLRKQERRAERKREAAERAANPDGVLAESDVDGAGIDVDVDAALEHDPELVTAETPAAS
jgi:hypothetical protein